MIRKTLAGIRLLADGTLPFLAGSEDPPAPAPPAPTPPAPAPAPAPAPPAPTLTQADVDRIVQERLARDRKDRPTDEEIAKLRESQAELDKITAANLTEKERLEKEAAEAKAAAEAATAASKDATETANKRLIRAEIVAAAAAAGAVDASAVYSLLKDQNFAVTGADQKQLEVTLDDDGEVTGAKEAVTAFLAEKKFLVGSTPDPGPGGGGAHPTPTPADDPGKLTDPKAVRDYAKSLRR